LIRVGIVDDHPVFRFGLRRSLEREPDLKVAWEAARASEALKRVPTDEVDVVLMDLDLGPNEDALGTTRAITERYRPVKVIVVSATLEWEAAAAARSAGASGYLRKDTAIPDMVAAIRRLALETDGPSDFGEVEPVRITEKTTWAERQGLSARERQVLDELCRGSSNREIAATLHVSTSTVNKHVQHVLMKLQVRTRGQAVARANART
jgi:DNA-binding NarL/FixJ family response regulator